MANINRVVLVGNLTKDPELRHTAERARPSASFGLAVNTRQKDGQTGEWTDKPNYFDVTVWGNQGESCAQYLAQGSPRRHRRPARLASSGRRRTAPSARRSRSSRHASSSSAAAATRRAAASASSCPPARTTENANADFGNANDDDIPF